MINKIIVTLLALILLMQIGSKVYAQSGQVIIFSAVPGTTAAANCGVPTTPSECVVGDGVWIWQAGATAWAKPLTTAPASGGMTSLTINGVTKTGTAPSFTITQPAVVVSAQTPAITTQ